MEATLFIPKSPNVLRAVAPRLTRRPTQSVRNIHPISGAHGWGKKVLPPVTFVDNSGQKSRKRAFDRGCGKPLKTARFLTVFQLFSFADLVRCQKTMARALSA